MPAATKTKPKPPKNIERPDGLNADTAVVSGISGKKGTVTLAAAKLIQVQWEGDSAPITYKNNDIKTFLVQAFDPSQPPPPPKEKTPKSSSKKQDAGEPRCEEQVQTVALPTDKIRTDGGTQSRAELNDETIREYAEAKKEGAQFPPVVAYYDGENYWLADGFHRFEADRLNNAEAIAVQVRQGTQRDAILFSVGANATHGLRRTNADKRRAVLRLLEDEEWSKWGDSEIARRCGVTHTTVRRIRQEVSESSLEQSSSERAYTTKHGTVATMNTSRIGSTRSGGSGSNPYKQHILGLDPTKEQLLPSIEPNPDAPPDDESQRYQWQPGDWVQANQVGATAFQQWCGGRPVQITKTNNPGGDLRIYLIWLEREDGEFFSAWSNWVEPAETPKSPAASFAPVQSAEESVSEETPTSEEAIAESEPAIAPTEPSPRATFDAHGAPEDRSDEHYTPAYIWKLALECAGKEQFTLDPASNSHHSPNVPCEFCYTKEDDGLAMPWKASTLWLNPPYSNMREWVDKLLLQYEVCNFEQGFALVKGDSSTKWFQKLIQSGHPFCLINHRVNFVNENNSGGAKFPSVLVYLGRNFDRFYQTFDIRYSARGLGIVVQAGQRGVHFGE